MTIWIDLDNAPHVPLFLPIIDELEEMGHQVIITARDFNETLGLLQLAGRDYQKVGRHYGKKKVNKLVGFLIRAFQLYLYGRGKDVSIGVCHGSKSFPIAAGLLRIPVVYMFDYEYGKILTAFGITKFMVPAYITNQDLKAKRVASKVKVRRYSALKEEIYAHDFILRPEIIKELKLDANKVLVVIRPPASEAHYHNQKSDTLFVKVLEFLNAREEVQVVLLPRTRQQRSIALDVFSNKKRDIVIPNEVTNGLNLIWNSDLVISGGGTMIREAVALNVPAYSIFKGNLGAVDRYLSAQGLLHLVKGESDIEHIALKKRSEKVFPKKNSKLLSYIVNEILNVVD